MADDGDGYHNAPSETRADIKLRVVSSRVTAIRFNFSIVFAGIATWTDMTAILGTEKGRRKTLGADGKADRKRGGVARRQTRGQAE